MSEAADESHLFVCLYLDEDVHESLLPALRQRGYDVVNVREVNRRGLSDVEQLAYATGEGRTLFSFNAVDYIALHLHYVEAGLVHAGILVARQMPVGETLNRLLTFLDLHTSEELKNRLY